MKSDSTTIRSHLLTSIPDLGPCGIVDLPVCSMEMARFLGRLEFQTHPDAIKAGLHIFGVCHPTQEAVAKANEIVGVYTKQVMGSTSLTVTKSLALKKSQKLLLPTNLSELRFVIMGYVGFLAVTLGRTHPVVEHLRLLSDRLTAEEMRFYLHFCSLDVPWTVSCTVFIMKTGISDRFTSSKSPLPTATVPSQMLTLSWPPRFDCHLGHHLTTPCLCRTHFGYLHRQHICSRLVAPRFQDHPRTRRLHITSPCTAPTPLPLLVHRRLRSRPGQCHGG
jgi:hypothetical protein